MNIYEEAMKHASCLQPLSLNNFDKDFKQTYDTAKEILDKKAGLYKVVGTRIILMTHSDRFKTTPDQISWYEIVSSDKEMNLIRAIVKLEDEYVSENLPDDNYEEINFFVQAAKTARNNS